MSWDKKLACMFCKKGHSRLLLPAVFQTIYGEILPIHSNNDVAGLTHFLIGRLLGNPDIARAFAHPQVPGLYRQGKRISSFIHRQFRLFATRTPCFTSGSLLAPQVPLASDWTILISTHHDISQVPVCFAR